MTAEIVNLRRARKARARDAAALEASANRARFGETKASREARRLEEARASRVLDAGQIADGGNREG